MILFSELAKVGKAHVNFNSAIIKLVSEIFKGERIEFYGEKHHTLEVAKQLPGNSTKCYYFRSLDVISSIAFIRGLKILLKELIFITVILFLFIKCILKKPEIFIVTSISPVSHYVFKWVKRLILPKQKVIIILHGEVEVMIERPNYYYRVLQKALVLSTPNCQYMVLGSWIKMNMIKEFHLTESLFLNIHHPYHYNFQNSIKERHISKIIIGMIGIQNMKFKHSHLIFKLAKKFEANIERGEVMFKIVGLIEPDLDPFINNLVDQSGVKKNGLLSDDEFRQNINDLDYMVFFYPTNSYRFISSGVFFDAIKFGKPIIAIQNDFFNYYFDLLGDIGFLCKDLSEMAEIIDDILIDSMANKERYLIQQNNLKNAALKLTNDIEVELQNQLLNYI